jgi:hypothetical protein
MQPMSDRSSRNESRDTAFPKALLDALSPASPWHEGFTTIFTEWQTFVAHRVQQDLMLWQRVAKSTTPQEIVAAHTEFWPKVFLDYWQEYATISKLLVGIAGNVTSETQTVTLDADRATPSAKAA